MKSTLELEINLRIGRLDRQHSYGSREAQSKD